MATNEKPKAVDEAGDAVGPGNDWKACLGVVVVLTAVAGGVLLWRSCARHTRTPGNGDTVTVQGKVGRVLDWGYTLNDGRGEMPVIPTGPSPAVGQKVRVTGVIKAPYVHTFRGGRTMDFPVAIVEGHKPKRQGGVYP